MAIRGDYANGLKLATPVVALAVLGLHVQLVHRPAQRVAVDVEIHRQRTGHQVAVEVGHVAHGDIDVGLLQISVRLVQIQQQVLLVGHVAELQVLALSCVVDGCEDVAIAAGCSDGLAQDGVALQRVVALVVACLLDAHT